MAHDAHIANRPSLSKDVGDQSETGRPGMLLIEGANINWIKELKRGFLQAWRGMPGEKTLNG